MSDIWLLIIFLLPILLVVLLRVNAVFVYLGLCLGYVLTQFVVNTKLTTKIPDYNKVSSIGTSSNVHLLLLILPPLIIILSMIKTAPKKKLLSINLAGAVAVGILALVTVVPRLPLHLALEVVGSSAWVKITKYEGILVAVASLFILVLLISHRSKLKPQQKEGKHHKSKD